jgi:hypothetical protein
MDQLTDPESLADRGDVDFTEETRAVSQEAFPAREGWNGIVVVGVTNSAGDVLLVNLAGGHGWVLPHGPVAPGDDYMTAGPRWTEEMTGITVRIESIERATRINYTVVDDECQTVNYNVVLGASPATSGLVPDASDIANEDIQAVGWVDQMPEDVEWDHDDFREDAQRFLTAGNSD